MKIAEYTNSVDPDKPAQDEPLRLDLHRLLSSYSIFKMINLGRNGFFLIQT